MSYTVDKDAVDNFLGIPDSLRMRSSEARKTPQQQIGFVAQEVDAVVKKSGYVFSGVEVPQNENDPYTIRYEEFVVPLVKAVQELSAHSNEQKKEITELKGQLGNDTSPTVYVLFQENSNLADKTIQIPLTLPPGVREANIVLSTRKGKKLKDFPVIERGDISLKISGNELSPGMYTFSLIADGKVINTEDIILTE